MPISTTRAVVICVGIAVCALAGHKLTAAIQHAMETGMVLLHDTRPSAPGRRGVVYPYGWQEAWAYFAGWGIVAVGGLFVAISSTRRLWPLLLALPLFLVAFMLIAATPMLGSWEGVILFGSVFFGACLIATVVILWLGARDHRRVEMEPEIQDRKRRDNAA